MQFNRTHRREMGRAGSVADEHLIRREIYNPNDFGITFELMPDMVPYIQHWKITLGPERIYLKPHEWVMLNHWYYKRTADNGAPLFPLTVNFGDLIGKGNKLPSRPD